MTRAFKVDDNRSWCEQLPRRLAAVATYEDAKGVVGIGGIRVTAESYIALDPEATHKRRVLAAEELVREGKLYCQSLSLTDMHAFLTGENTESFERFLKGLGFVGHTGPVLVLNL